MKIKYYHILFLTLILFILSCKIFFNKQTEEEKYREKSPVNIIKLNSINGNISFDCWKEDFVEIQTLKTIFTGLSTEFNMMNTSFERKDKELSITSRIPASINGKIDLKIFAPYNVLKLIIRTKKSDVSISDFLGDIELDNSDGSNNIDFHGTVLRANLKNTKTILNVSSYNHSDMVLNDELGILKIYIKRIGVTSNLDMNLINSETFLYTSKNIHHDIFALNKGKKINIMYNILKDLKNADDNYVLKGKYGRYSDDFKIYLNANNSKIYLQQM
jgi:hypothetical protein